MQKSPAADDSWTAKQAMFLCGKTTLQTTETQEPYLALRLRVEDEGNLESAAMDPPVVAAIASEISNRNPASSLH